jgi:membrane protein implicated in regulation of membrane protease activity
VRRGPESVYVEGELWSARAAEGATLPGTGRVRIIGREGMTLIVEPLDGAGEASAIESKES